MSADDGVTPGGSAGRGNRHQQKICLKNKGRR